ncbi:MAG: phosphoribosylamine--glycine ligase [Thermoplasmatota archaeon]
MNVLVVGGGAREHVMCDAVHRSDKVALFSVMKNINPGIKSLAGSVLQQKETMIDPIVGFVDEKDIDLVLIGPEAPLQAGLTDALQNQGIMVCAPTQAAARIETDKEWMRKILKKYQIAGQIKWSTFTDVDKAISFVNRLDGEVALKPIGLTGGKGVRVAGDHFKDSDGARSYIKSIFDDEIGGQSKVLVEEKAVGEEFTIQAFSDGKTILPLPAVQDHKRLLPGDKGPNTGGMGSYSDKNGLLPFLSKSEYEQAATILQNVVEALSKEQCSYVGPIYGQFMLTSDGPKIIEINARFGDPEAMNVLPLLDSDFVSLCQAMVNGEVEKHKLRMKRMATVCKYVVPEGYGKKSMADETIKVDEQQIRKKGSQLFYASVNKSNDYVTTTSSRSLAVVGMGDDIATAEHQCEQSLQYVSGDHMFIRHDVGTAALIQKRIDHMKQLRGL